MAKLLVRLLAVFISLGELRAQTQPLLITTLNCYLFFGGGETTKDFDQPKISSEYWKKAVNLVGLLPTNAPLLVAFEEVGRGREVTHLAQIAAAKYKLRYAPLFVQGRDTFTGEDVGGMMCFDMGWGIAVQPARDPLLDQWLSKHLVVRLTNAVTALDVCVVHLRRAIGGDGITKQQQQTEALKIWADRHLKENSQANLIILGDFNEIKKPGEPVSASAPLVKPKGPLVDTFTLSAAKPRTHANGKAYDRIVISPAMVSGATGLKFESLSVKEHTHGKGKERLLFTDHFPLTAEFVPVEEKTTR